MMCKDCGHHGLCRFENLVQPLSDGGRICDSESIEFICGNFEAAALAKRGHWIRASINGVRHYRCSACGEYIEVVWTANFDYKYCPNCGVQIDEEDHHAGREIDP